LQQNLRNPLAVFRFMIVSPGFRWTVIAVLVAAAIGVYWLIENNKKEDERYWQQEAANERWALTSIKQDDIALTGVSLVQNGTSWQLKGTVTNNSKFDPSKIKFLITVQDCAVQPCQTIGQETVHTSSESYSTNDQRSTLKVQPAQRA
jgi:hypothetical protein